MKKRKTKSRMTRVDLDAVLKLQRDYDYLESELRKLFSCAMAFAEGNTTYGDYTISSDNNYIHIAMLTMKNMADKIKELEDEINNSTNPAPTQG